MSNVVGSAMEALMVNGNMETDVVSSAVEALLVGSAIEA